MSRLKSNIFKSTIEYILSGNYSAAKIELTRLTLEPEEMAARKLYDRLKEIIDSGGDLSYHNFEMLSSPKAFYGKGNFGWESIVRDVQALVTEVSDKGTQIVPHMESALLWGCDDFSPQKNWVGMLHTGIDYENEETVHKIKELFNSDKWLHFKSSCIGIFVFSSSQRSFLRKVLELDVPVIKIPFILPKVDVTWEYNNYIANNHKKLVYAGASNRFFSSFINTEVPERISKILIKHTDLQYWNNAVGLSQKELNSRFVEVVPFVDKQTFDAFKKANIFYFDFSSLGYSSTLAELIASGTPFIINKSKETLDILGEDYPLYYEAKSSLSEILVESRIQKASQYLVLKKRNRFTDAKSLIKVINRSLNISRSADNITYPKVTVVTVVLNMPDLLERTIKSVLAQNYPNLEYVIVDGGSNTQTLDVIRKYESHIDFWNSEPDKGIYDAMNKGAKCASGTWVNFLNAGDTFISDTTVADVFEIADFNDDLIYGDTLFQDDNGDKIVKASAPEELWRAMIFNHNCLFVRTSLQREHPFSSAYKIVADSEFIIWCYVNGKKFKNVEIPINTYENGGYADQNSIMRSVERWKVVSDYKLKPQNEINDYYFQRLLWEDECKAYLSENYNITI